MSAASPLWLRPRTRSDASWGRRSKLWLSATVSCVKKTRTLFSLQIIPPPSSWIEHRFASGQERAVNGSKLSFGGAISLGYSQIEQVQRTDAFNTIQHLSTQKDVYVLLPRLSD